MQAERVAIALGRLLGVGDGIRAAFDALGATLGESATMADELARALRPVVADVRRGVHIFETEVARCFRATHERDDEPAKE